MFKNAIVYRIGADWQMPDLEDLTPLLARQAFEPCSPTQEEASGWVHPRPEDHSPLVEAIAGQVILKLMVERKSVPAGAVKAELDRRCKQIEQERGTKPQRKEKKELKEDIYLELLPRAFAKKSAHYVWIDPVNRFLLVDTGSQRGADQVVEHVIELMAAVGHILPIRPLQTATAPATAMAHWLAERLAPTGFTVDRDLELRQPDDTPSKVRYSNHNLDIDEVVAHIESGKLPMQLALTWDSRVSFMLTAELALRKLELLEDVFKDTPEDEARSFEGDVALITGELVQLLPALIDVLDGEAQPEEAETAEPAQG